MLTGKACRREEASGSVPLTRSVEETEEFPVFLEHVPGHDIARQKVDQFTHRHRSFGNPAA